MADTNPKNYWEYAGLRLAFVDKKNFSVDTASAKKHKLVANTPLDYVSQLQADLITLGYLRVGSNYKSGLYGETTRRAVLRFQRHAARPYRKPGPDARMPEVSPTSSMNPFQLWFQNLCLPPPTQESQGPQFPFTNLENILFTGPADGICDHATALEVRRWISRGLKVPVGRFSLRELRVGGKVVGKLREDAAIAWEEIVSVVEGKGGILKGPYGDTTRVLQKTTKSGTSKLSFHYCGRAVDINQALGGGKDQRYYIVKEASGQTTWWRIYCKTQAQDGTQGTQLTGGKIKAYSFSNHKEYNIPAGYYLDLTALIESTGRLERIKAQKGWETTYNKTEWWHFQYKVDQQATFLDEVELIGYTEKQLLDAGWTLDEMDRSPG